MLSCMFAKAASGPASTQPNNNKAQVFCILYILDLKMQKKQKKSKKKKIFEMRLVRLDRATLRSGVAIETTLLEKDSFSFKGLG